MRKMILVAAAIVTASAAQAAPTLYFTSASFTAAVGATTLTDFNGFGSDTSFQSVSVDAGAFSLLGFGFQYDRNFIDAAPVQFSDFNVDGTTVVNAVSDQAAGLTITFDAPVIAFGADFRAINTTGAEVNFVFNGITVNIGQNNTYNGFFGFVSDTPFTSLTLTGGFGDGYSFDNVLTANAGPAVPEPATWAMMIGGFALAGATMRRRKAAVSFA